MYRFAISISRKEMQEGRFYGTRVHLLRNSSLAGFFGAGGLIVTITGGYGEVDWTATHSCVIQPIAKLHCYGRALKAKKQQKTK